MAEERSVFISHTHSDRDLADALKKLITRVFNQAIKVRYSSDREVGGGIKPGDDWFQWIVDEIRTCDMTLVLLTPASVQKPWPMWEAGAVSGATWATEKSRPLIPVRYAIDNEEIPSPLRNLQTVRGDTRAAIEKLLHESILKKWKTDFDPEVIGLGFAKLQDAFDDYMTAVRAAILNLPMPLSEAAIDEWCQRLDQLSMNRRINEVRHLHGWIETAFGGREKGQALPLDLRLHRRLGELYLQTEDFERAVEQFGLARKLAPRDLFILRSLGEALLKKKDFDKAKPILDLIEELDPEAYTWNAECVGLKGRYFRMRGDIKQAREMYAKALQADPSSYYMADNVGQLSLSLKDPEGAKDAYRIALQALNKLTAHNVWSRATAATANLVLDKEKAALDHLKKIHMLGPTPRQGASIEEGLERLGKALEQPPEKLQLWFRTLRGIEE
jgi:tetratricopeptide (TPR) repeat protein